MVHSYYGTAYFTRAGFQNPFIIQVVTNTVNVVGLNVLLANHLRANSPVC